MNARRAREILCCCRPTPSNTESREEHAAREECERNESLRETFGKQAAFDAAVIERIRVEVPPEAEERLDAVAGKIHERVRHGWRFSMRDPATLAVSFAFLVLVGLGVWLVLTKMDGFPGQDEVVEIALTGDKSQIEQFDPLEAEAGSLGDWFVLKGVDGVVVPEEFRGYKVAGVRVFPFEAEPVAVMAVPENRMFFYVFRGHRLGINVSPEGSWRLLVYDEAQKRALAIRQDRGICFMIAMRGSVEDVQRVIRKAEAGR
jgi:hypothetical protein